MTEMCLLKFDKVSKRYPYEKCFLLSDVSFFVNAGEKVGIVADVQCGKTTIVKMLAGLTKPTRGEIYFFGRQSNQVEVRDRGLGVVFDDYALMKGKTALKNIEYPLKVRKDKNYREKALAAANKFGLENVLSLKAKKLSPQDKLKVALARLSTRKLSLLVLDGVMANKEAEGAIQYISAIQSDAVLMLESDIKALACCDRVYVLCDGATAFEGNYDAALDFVNKTRCFDKYQDDAE